MTYFPRACGSLKVSTNETVIVVTLDSAPAVSKLLMYNDATLEYLFSPYSEDIVVNYLPKVNRVL